MDGPSEMSPSTAVPRYLRARSSSTRSTNADSASSPPIECGFRIFAAHAADSASDMRKPHHEYRTKIAILVIRALDTNGRPIAMSHIMLRQSAEPTNPAQCAGPLKELVS